MTESLSVEIVAKNPDVVGECPTWDAERGVLLWTDNRSQRIHSFDPESRRTEIVLEGHAAYGFTLQTDGSLLLFMANTRVAVARDGNVETVIDGLPGLESTRFNDVLVDPKGRVLCGVLPTEARTGSLQNLTPDGKVRMLHEGMDLPNGMALSPDNRTLYVADTRARHVLAFAYDVERGDARDPRVLIELGPGEGSPDGVTVDEEGGVWVAATGSARVARYDGDGRLLRRYALPAQKPTSVGFGGGDMGTLFVTSSSREASPGENLGAEAGALFAMRPGVRGRPEHRTAWGV